MRERWRTQQVAQTEKRPAPADIVGASVSYLETERYLSENGIMAYRSDLRQFQLHLPHGLKRRRATRCGKCSISCELTA